MRRVLLLLVPAVLVLMVSARGADLPEALEQALPEGAEEFLEGADLTGAAGFTDAVAGLLEKLGSQAADLLRQQIRGSASILAVVVLCGAAEGLCPEGTKAYLAMAGGLSVTMLAAGDLDTLIGLGSRTIGELADFSKVLLPVLAAATAAGGAVTTATVQQVTAVFLVELLLQLVSGVLLPLVYLYIGVTAAAACLPGKRLGAIAGGLKKLVTWLLTASLLAFTLYLSAARVISGSADAAAVKVTKAAISGTVPVVGGIIAEASEAVLAGAGMLKNAIGVFGTLGVLGACAYPFLRLGLQYLLYKVTAFLAAALGAEPLGGLIDGLGSAFGLVLGMTGSCAILILISVLASVGAVMP